MPRIVAGVSGSAASRRAVEAAAWEADGREHPLHLAHSFGWPPGIVENPWILLDEAVAAATRVAPSLTITTEVMEGDPLTGLLRLSRHAALTVIGDGNLNNLVCLPATTMAVQLAGRAASAVMITRPTPAPDGPVVVGISDYAGSEQVLDFAFDAAAHRQTGLVVVHVCETGNGTDPLEEAIAAGIRAYRIDARLRSLEGDPTAVMNRESQDAALIVVGARGRLPYHGLLGSVAQTLLHHCRAPIVVVRGVIPAPRHGTRSDATTTPVSALRAHPGSASAIPRPAQETTSR
jgi:nucleotide-binding universal stress UspA family protein